MGIPLIGPHVRTVQVEELLCQRPKCANAWQKRGEDMPVVCPKCIHPDSFISGAWQSIASLDTEDTVIGKQGTQTSILETFSHDFSGHLVQLTAVGCLPISVTPDHALPVLTCTQKGDMRGRTLSEVSYVAAADIIPRPRGSQMHAKWHQLLIPRLKGIIAKVSIDLTPFCTSEQSLIVATAKSAPLQYVLTKESVWLMGLYIAEGSSSHHQISFSLGSHESALIERARLAIQSLGYTPRIVPDGSVTSIYLQSRLIARAFREWFGKDCYTKKIPDFIFWHVDNEILVALLRGYYDGDGHFTETKYLQLSASTVSQQLSLQIQLLGARLGGLICINKFDYSKYSSLLPNGRVISGGDAYISRTSSNILIDALMGTARNKPSMPYSISNEYIGVPVKRTDLQSYSGPVRNMHTEDGHYTVSNIVVKNCKSKTWWRPRVKPVEETTVNA